MIPHTMRGGYKVITPEVLRQVLPAAYEAMMAQEPEKLDIIWIMTEKPVPNEDSAETDDDGTTYYTEWTQTNEPELAEWLAEDWDRIAVNVDGEQVVFLCGTMDDEYGDFWDNGAQEWSNYMF
jgi:hypothetical protein